MACLYIIYVDIMIMLNHKEIRDIENPIKKLNLVQFVLISKLVITISLEFVSIYYYPTYVDITYIIYLVRSKVTVFSEFGISQLEEKYILSIYYSELLIGS